MRKKNLWKKTASVIIAAAMIMSAMPVYAGTADVGDEVIIQENAGEENVGEVVDEEISTQNGKIIEVSNAESFDIINDNSTAEGNNLVDGATIKLKGNITVDTSISTSKNFTLDLNNYTLTITNPDNYFLGTVTIKNGTIDIGSTAGSADCIIGIGHYQTNSAELTLDRVELTGNNYKSPFAVLYAYSGCMINIKDSHLQLNNEQATSGGVIKGTKDKETKSVTSSVIVDNSELEFQNTVRGFNTINTTIKNQSKITITGSNSGLDNAINDCPLVIEDSQVSISGGTGRGITLDGADGTISNSKVDISDMAEAGIRFKKANTLNIMNNSEVTVGNILVDSSATLMPNKVVNIDDSSSCNALIIQGVISGGDNSGQWSFAGEEEAIKRGMAALIGDVAYQNISGAISAAEKEATIKLLKDTNEDVTISSGKNIILDLAGKTLTNTNSHTITNEGTLTIQDSVGNGTVDNITHEKAAVKNLQGATVILNGGNYTRSQENGQNSSDNGGNSFYNIQNFGIMTINDGVTVSQDGHYSSMIANGWFDGSQNHNQTGAELIINGGMFTGGLNTIKNDDWGNLTINGGTFKNVTQFAFMNWNKATINGGSFISDGAVISNGKANNEMDCGILTIKGGSFTAGKGKEIFVKNGGPQTTIGTISVSGGTFSSDPSKYLASGCYAHQGSNNWGVSTTNGHDYNYKNDGYTYYCICGDSVYIPPYTPPEPTTPPATTDTVTNPDGSTTSTTTQENTDGSTTTTVVDKDANGNVTGTTETVEKTEGNTTTKTETTTAADGSQTVTESTLVKNEDGSSKETGTITKADGTVATVETNTKADGSATEVIQETAKNDAGKEVAITTTTTTDTEGAVTGVTEKSDIKNVAENTTATVTVRKDGDDNVKTSRATVVKTVDEDTTKVTLAGAVVDQIVKASGTSNVTVTLDVKNEEDDTKYTVKVATKNLEAGNKLYVYKVNPETGERTMVNDKLYTVSENGSITFNTKQNADFVLVNKASAAATNKAIKKTLTPAKTSIVVKTDKTAKMKLNSALNMENVKNITYSTTKSSVAKVSSNGTITAKKAGEVYITATITLKNGYKKTVRTKVTVK